MSSSTRLERQGDDQYEVIFEDGSKKTGLSLMQAVDVIEDHLDQDRKKSHTLSDDSDSSADLLCLGIR